MTETFYRTGICKADHSEFSGRICASDFDRKTTLSEMAARIMADRRFDQQCRKNRMNNEICQAPKIPEEDRRKQI